jgi:hypothetical protein
VGGAKECKTGLHCREAGDFVEVRTRRWLVERTGGEALVRARLACIDDDVQGERLEILWHDEVDASVVADSHLSVFENPGTDDPEVFSAYLRSIRWNTATAADRKLLQAPFRAGIHLDAHHLVPLASINICCSGRRAACECLSKGFMPGIFEYRHGSLQKNQPVFCQNSL